MVADGGPDGVAAGIDEREAAEAAREVEREYREGELDGALPSLALPFGPAFFLGPLRGLVRERCPVPGEAFPRVTIHLADGEALDVCHVIALATDWVALAVYDPAQPIGTRAMATALVPYGSIARVSIRAGLPDDPSLGFDATRRAVVLTDTMPASRTAEELLRAASAGPASATGHSVEGGSRVITMVPPGTRGPEGDS